MRRSHKPITIASRRSPLARAQAQAVGRALSDAGGGVKIEYHWIDSQGDQLPHVLLADAGGKGLFAHVVEQAVRNQEADIAVHSLKDLPANEPAEGLVIAAVPRRADVRDWVISQGSVSLEQFPQGATLGTASPRRAAQIKKLRPDITTGLIRGNIETRLKKVLEQRQYDATLLAVAGLRRAGLSEHIQCPLDPSVMLPAAGQGALAIQCRADHHATLSRCLLLNDPATSAAVHAERHIVAALGGDCHSPIAVFAQPIDTDTGNGFRVRAQVLSPDGQKSIEVDMQAGANQLRQLVSRVITQLHEKGSKQLLEQE